MFISMLGLADKLVLDDLARRLRAEFPEARIWAFGSRARGEATADSDFDVCVTLPRVDESLCDRVRHIAWEAGFDHGDLFNTMIFSMDEMERGPMSKSSLVANILRDRIAA
ncbi:MAG: nucleotidyltransferase domain-containing protein [Candidatus Sumerlaeota bacterium]|nr:nucleotidyltransferase domain-containing protein [Candidatus Sumerlaeota bacterium]